MMNSRVCVCVGGGTKKSFLVTLCKHLLLHVHSHWAFRLGCVEIWMAHVVFLKSEGGTAEADYSEVELVGFSRRCCSSSSCIINSVCSFSLLLPFIFMEILRCFAMKELRDFWLISHSLLDFEDGSSALNLHIATLRQLCSYGWWVQRMSRTTSYHRREAMVRGSQTGSRGNCYIMGDKMVGHSWAGIVSCGLRQVLESPREFFASPIPSSQPPLRGTHSLSTTPLIIVATVNLSLSQQKLRPRENC